MPAEGSVLVRWLVTSAYPDNIFGLDKPNEYGIYLPRKGGEDYTDDKIQIVKDWFDISEKRRKKSDCRHLGFDYTYEKQKLQRAIKQSDFITVLDSDKKGMIMFRVNSDAETKQKKEEKKRKAMKRKSMEIETETIQKKFAKVGEYWSDGNSPGSSSGTSSSPEVLPLDIHQGGCGSPHLLSDMKDNAAPYLVNTSMVSAVLDRAETHDVSRFSQRHLETLQNTIPGTSVVPMIPGLLNFSPLNTSAVDTHNSVDITNTVIDAVKIAESCDISHLSGNPVELKLVSQDSGTNYQQLNLSSNAHFLTKSILILIPQSSEMKDSNVSPSTVNKCKNGAPWNFSCGPFMGTELSSSGAVPMKTLNFPPPQQAAVDRSLESGNPNNAMDFDNTVEYNDLLFPSVDKIKDENCDDSYVISEETMVQSGAVGNTLVVEGISDEDLLTSEDSPLGKSLSREDSDISLHINSSMALFPELLSNSSALSEYADKIISVQLPNDSSYSEPSNVKEISAELSSGLKDNICHTEMEKCAGYYTAGVTNKHTTTEITDNKEPGSRARSVENFKRCTEMDAMMIETRLDPSSEITLSKGASIQKVVYTTGDQAVPTSPNLFCSSSSIVPGSPENNFHHASVYSGSSPDSPHLYPDFWETFGKFTSTDDGTIQYSKISRKPMIVCPTEHSAENCATGLGNPGLTTDGSSCPKRQDPDASFNLSFSKYNILSPLEDPWTAEVTEESPGSVDINNMVSQEKLALVQNENANTPFEFKTLSFGDEFQELINYMNPEYTSAIENQAMSFGDEFQELMNDMNPKYTSAIENQAMSDAEVNQEIIIPEPKMVFPQEGPKQQEGLISCSPDGLFQEKLCPFAC